VDGPGFGGEEELIVIGNGAEKKQLGVAGFLGFLGGFLDTGLEGDQGADGVAIGADMGGEEDVVSGVDGVEGRLKVHRSLVPLRCRILLMSRQSASMARARAWGVS